MLLSIFTTTEFYVTVLVIAASVIAFAAMPAHRGEVREYLLAGDLVVAEESESIPSISVECQESGAVTLIRKGIDLPLPPAAVSLAVSVKGFDVTINERIVAGMAEGAPVEAVFSLDFMGSERYHIRYVSDVSSRSCSLILHNRPGIKITKFLSR